MTDNTPDLANPPNCFTVVLHEGISAITSDFLPLCPRSYAADGNPEIARVKVGRMYIGVGVYNNPDIGEPDVLSGAWLPTRIERKDPKPGAKTSHVLLVPYRTVFGSKRPPAYKQLILVRGMKGSVIAPPSSECVEVLRSDVEVLLLVNSGCSFQVTKVNGDAVTVFIGQNGKAVVVPAVETLMPTQWSDFTVQKHSGSTPPAQSVEDNTEIFETWKRLSTDVDMFSENSPDKDWLELLYVTLKSMYPRWSKRVAHVYPERPYQGVCLPLTAATYQSPTYGSQWAIDSQYFAGYYDASGINQELGAGAMPANRLLMRCIYEMYWLSKAPKSEHPEPGSVLLTVPSLLN